MATTATPVRGASYVAGNKKHRIYDVAFSGSYATDGSETTVTAEQFGLQRMFTIQPQGGMAAAAALTTANEIAITLNAAGTSAEITMYENAAAGSPSAEKGAEAFITTQSIRVLVIGY